MGFAILKNLQDWEVEALSSFMAQVYVIIPNLEEEDLARWKFDKSGRFGVSSFYTNLGGQQRIFLPWKAIWRKKVPLTVVFFSWTVVVETIQTIDNLRRRGQLVVNRCIMCKVAEETVYHLLIHYPMV